MKIEIGCEGQKTEKSSAVNKRGLFPSHGNTGNAGLVSTIIRR